MAISTVMGFFDDIARLSMRPFMGRRGNDPIAYENPKQLIGALRNPATEARAVARMQKMHYGAFYRKESRGIFSGLAERELLKKGKGFGGAIFGRPVKGLSVGISHLKGALAFSALQGIGESYFADKGHKMSGMVGGFARAATFGVGDMIGTAIGGPIAGLILGSITEKAGGLVGEGVQMFNDFNRSVKHVNMGGNFEDNRQAYSMRQRAAQEMGTSVLNARTYLGMEAKLFHD